MTRRGLGAVAPRLALVLALLTCAGGASAQLWGGGGKGGALPYADPADAISANLGFLRLVRDKGLAAAVKASAAPGARILAAGEAAPESAADLRGARARDSRGGAYGPPQWPVQQVWMSCDAALAVTAGALPDHSTSLTVWQRQKKGAYQWVLHLDGLVSDLRPVAAPAGDAMEAEMIGASVADCQARGRHAAAGPVVGEAAVAPAGDGGAAPDGTLAWAYGERRFSLRMKREGAMRDAFGATGLVASPAPPGQR